MRVRSEATSGPRTQASKKSKGSAPDASSSGETSNSSSYSTRRCCFDSMGLAHPEGQADLKKGAGKGRAEQGRQATIRTPSNITKTEFCLVTHQGSGSGARGQALCTLLLVGGGDTPVEGTACIWLPQRWSGRQQAAASCTIY